MHQPAYRLKAPLANADLRELRRAAWGPDSADWSRIHAHSLCWVTAQVGSQLVGYVNVAWDGGLRAFLLDTTVHPGWQRRGVGRELVRRAEAAARAQGCEWLHVDHEPQLAPFYAACGFRPTPAGLIRLCP